MAINVNTKIRKLPAGQRQKIAARARALRAEEMTRLGIDHRIQGKRGAGRPPG